MNAILHKIGLGFFLVVAIIGTLLRSTHILSIPIKYMNFVHAHSHVAFQGWIYTTLFLFLVHFYIPEDRIKKSRYGLQYGITIIIVIGILISFILQGYGLYSIIFSTLFQILNYWFFYSFFKDTKHLHQSSLLFIKTGIIYGIISTIMPFIIGYLSAKGYAGTELYQSAVYSFLHLQYNGWFLFIVLGLLIEILTIKNFQFNAVKVNRFYWYMTLAVIPSISLSLLGMESFSWALYPAIVSVILLLGGLFYFIKLIPSKLLVFERNKSIWINLFFWGFVLSFLLKLTLQCLSIVPQFETYAFLNRSIIIAYLHLSLIGSISFFFFFLLLELRWLKTNFTVKLGSFLLIMGYIVTEVCLVLIGLSISNKHTLLLVGSIAMAMGIFLMLLSPSTRETI